MFKNREIRIRLAKPEADPETATEPESSLARDIYEDAPSLLKTTALCVAFVIVTTAAVHIVEEIAIYHGTKK